LISVAATVGCGGGGEGDGGDEDGTDIDASNGGTGANIPADFTRLIGRTWSLPAGQPDTYKCVRVTIPNDTYITNIMSQAPSGSHHAVLSIAGGNGTSGPDGEYDCGVSTLGTVMLYASGVGTSPLDFPAGVGIKVAAGTQLHLNLHLYNASDAAISGDSAILVKQQSTPPPTLAEMVFAGKFLFQIPNNNQPYTTSGGCTANRDYTLFAVWPHQHKLGTHHKFEIVRNGTATVLHDDAFGFEEQNYYLMSPEFQVLQGDQIRTTCTWVNNTGGNVGFGDSSDQEMCFTGLYRYPAPQTGGTNLFQCTDTGGAGF
jgi:hypothetical protein